MTARAGIYSAIDAERGRQRAKWADPHDWGIGDCSSLQVDPMVKLAVLLEEVGEVARGLLEKDPDQVRTELIEVAAVAVAWSESLTDVEPDLFDGVAS